MKKIVLLLLAATPFTATFAQQKEEAEKIVSEGIAYHDKGDYDGAITRYDKALDLDKNNLLALAEKATTLLAQQKYDDVIDVCKKAIKAHPKDQGEPNIYVAYGNALDGLKKTDESVEIYDKGIKFFPNNHQLHFNKGITLTSVQKYDEALLCFQASATLSPDHASSHNAIAKVEQIKNKQLPSLLAYWRFLVIEPQSARAKANLPAMQKVMGSNVEKKDDKNINITLFMDADKGKKDNDFSGTEMILSLTAALDFSDEHKNETDIQRFLRKMETVCASVSETRKDGKGFFWSYYVPYFVEMKEKKYLETFAYIAFATSENPEVATWLKENADKIKEFYSWSKAFSFKAN